MPQPVANPNSTTPDHSEDVFALRDDQASAITPQATNFTVEVDPPSWFARGLRYLRIYPWATVGAAAAGGLAAGKVIADKKNERDRRHEIHRVQMRMAAMPHEAGNCDPLPSWHPASPAARAAAQSNGKAQATAPAQSGVVVGALAALLTDVARHLGGGKSSGGLFGAIMPGGTTAAPPPATASNSAGRSSPPGSRGPSRVVEVPTSPPTDEQNAPPERERKRQRHIEPSVLNLFKVTFTEWSEDKCPRLGAALAYYTVFSIAPLLVITLAIAAFFLGPIAQEEEQEGTGVPAPIRQQMDNMLGQQAADGLVKMLAGAHQKEQTGIVATVLGVVALIFGASGVFGQLKDSLNTIWDVEAKPGLGVWQLIKDRLLSFAMVLSIAFLLLVSLLVSAALAAVQGLIGDFIPGPDIIATVLDLVVSLGVITLLFALMFKFVPDVECTWRDVWLGAAVTAVLFTIGKFAIGLYLGQAGVGSAYGAAGSLVIVMLWAYYSSQILFLGAEFTQVYARMYGSHFTPKPHAQVTTEEARAEQGLSPRAA